jgi:hypothetical protein
MIVPTVTGNDPKEMQLFSFCSKAFPLGPFPECVGDRFFTVYNQEPTKSPVSSKLLILGHLYDYKFFSPTHSQAVPHCIRL